MTPTVGPWSGHDDIWRYLDELAVGPAVPRARTLHRMRGLVDALGRPQQVFPSIHVTGTNGKGSTVAYAAALLAGSGLRVGTYTSPHLHHLTERVRVDGQPVDQDRMGDAIARVVKAAPDGVDHSWFEVITAAAYVLLAESEIDVAVVEVGALGRVDATNVIDASVAVVTNIEIEHADRAGPTRRHIATEKSGIVRHGATLVLGEPDPSLADVWSARRAGRIVRTGADYGARNRQRTESGTFADLWTPWAERDAVRIGAAGAYQCANAATALAAAEAYLGRAVSPSAVASALADTRVGGRWDVVGHRPTIVLDAAHNAAGAAAVAGTVAEELADLRPRVLVVGVRGRRSPAGLLAALRPEQFDHVVCTEPPAADACPAGMVAAALCEPPAGGGALSAAGHSLPESISVEAVPAWPDALARAGDLAGASGAVLVTGSLYLVGAAHGALVG